MLPLCARFGRWEPHEDTQAAPSACKRSGGLMGSGGFGFGFSGSWPSSAVAGPSSAVDGEVTRDISADRVPTVTQVWKEGPG